MKQPIHILLALALLLSIGVHAQQVPSRNLVIFLMDGYRWQELYQGADSSILFDKQYNHNDSAWTVAKYWDKDQQERRHKLMPFVWETIARQGQLLGNRQYGNFVNVENKYWFSYPGRSEIFTGYFDSAVNSNEYPDNPNTNVLEFINQQPAFHGKIATFSSWDAVARILNRNRNGMLVNIYGEDVKGDALTPLQKEANFWQHTLPDIFGKCERLDAGTYPLAKSYLLANHPRILYIDLGDNDDFAHAGDYGDYLDAAHYADAMFKDIWTTLQQDPFYKGKTDLLIFPDHGRGIGAGWTTHGSGTPHSDETYLIAMGPGIAPKGEVKSPGQIYQKQYAQTIAALLGFHFTAQHPIAEPVQTIVKP
ncbi:MAG: phosphoglyceromutase [Bacteroidota bacterium]